MAESDKPKALAEDFFVGGTERDAITLVRDASKIALPKRFYTDVSVEPRDGAFAILLDGRPVRTPRRSPLTLPTHDAADLVAEEWRAQTELIDPSTMPVTRLVNAAIDGVAGDIDAVAADIVKYSGSDLLYYRASEPAALVAAQNRHWDPVLDFVRETFGARFAIGEGLMFVSQPQDSVDAIARAVAGIAQEPNEVLRIAALHLVTTLTGSALLALAVYHGALTCDEAWAAAHVDEDEQMRVWGFDAEALRRRAARFEDMKAACALLAALSSRLPPAGEGAPRTRGG